MGQLRWLLCLQNGLYKSRVGMPLSCPSSKALRYVYVEEHLASLTLLIKMIIHLREMATISQILISLSDTPKMTSYTIQLLIFCD